MPAALRAPRGDWVALASRVLSDQGVGAVRVESLAAALGVTKGSFYSHFANRSELLQAVLDDWERRATDDVLERVEGMGAEPATNIRVAGLMTFGGALREIDLAIRHWARIDPAVDARLTRVDTARMDYLRAQFIRLGADPIEVEARSMLAFTFAIGRHFLPEDPDAAEAAAVMHRIGNLLGLAT